MTRSTAGKQESAAPWLTRRISRRSVVRGIAGLAGLAALPGLVATCGNGEEPSPPGRVLSSGPAASNAVGASSHEPPSPAAGSVTIAATAPIQDIAAAFTTKTGTRVRVSTIDSNTLADTIDAYLRGSPEDLLMWVTGYPMRDAAAKGLLQPIDDIWDSAGSAFSGALRDASTGDDGRLYAIPSTHAPWGVMYRRSLFDRQGYEIPLTWTDYLALAERMRRDGMEPMAFGDLEQFPALGVFDILNLRLNGTQFHVDLLARREAWTDRRVRDVLDLLRRYQETAQPDPVGRPFDAAATAFASMDAGMLYFGSFVAGWLPPDILSDVGMFAFPELGTEFDAEHTIEDPVDAFVVPGNSPGFMADLDSTKALLEFLTAPDVQATLSALGGEGSLPGVPLPSSDETQLQADAVRISAAAQRATQFFDRDTDRAFAIGFGALLKDFIADTSLGVGPFLERVQALRDQTR
jgi:multiple sugar transport system substrate-binding protein